MKRIIKVIHNEEAHEAAITELDKLMERNPRRGTPEFDQMELLALVIRDYEDKRFGKPLPPDPIEAIKFRMDQSNLKKKDLTPFLGNMKNVTEVLNRKRPLNLKMIRALHRGLGIPAESLLAESKTRRSEVKMIGKRQARTA